MPNELYTPVDFAELSLAASLNAGVSNEMIVNEDINSLEPKGWLVIRDPINGDEVIEYSGKDALTKKLTGLVRGVAGADVHHDAGRAVFGATTAQYVKQLVDRVNTISDDDFELSSRKLNLKDATTLTITSGAITINRSSHSIDTEGAAASDDLDSINGGVEGDLLYLRNISSSRIITLKHNVGNIRTPSENDTVLDLPDKETLLKFNGIHWLVITEFPVKLEVEANFPRGYLHGLILSNNSIDQIYDLDVGIGVARDESDLFNLKIDSVVTKQLDAIFAEGNNAGGRDSADALVANEEYHVYLIGDSTLVKATDVFFSTSTTPTLPSGYDSKRRIGSVFTDDLSNIRSFFHQGDYFRFKDVVDDFFTSSGSVGSYQTITLTVPEHSMAHVYVRSYCPSEVHTGVSLRSVGTTDIASSRQAIAACRTYTTSTPYIGALTFILTNENSQVEGTISAGSFGQLDVKTIGYIDLRGKDK